MFVKNDNVTEHIYKCAFVCLSYNYKAFFNGPIWNTQKSDYIF
jgi:hypothetical protein